MWFNIALKFLPLAGCTENTSEFVHLKEQRTIRSGRDDSVSFYHSLSLDSVDTICFTGKIAICLYNLQYLLFRFNLQHSTYVMVYAQCLSADGKYH